MHKSMGLYMMYDILIVFTSIFSRLNDLVNISLFLFLFNILNRFNSFYIFYMCEFNDFITLVSIYICKMHFMITYFK